MKMNEKYPMQIDKETFQPYYEVCGKKIYIEAIMDASAVIGKEQVKGLIIETYGEDVYEEIKDLL